MSGTRFVGLQMVESWRSKVILSALICLYQPGVSVSKAERRVQAVSDWEIRNRREGEVVGKNRTRKKTGESNSLNYSKRINQTQSGFVKYQE